MLGRLVPKDLWIPGIVRADLAVAVYNRIACIASEGNAVVCAVGDALHLFLRVAVERRIDGSGANMCEGRYKARGVAKTTRRVPHSRVQGQFGR